MGIGKDLARGKLGEDMLVSLLEKAEMSSERNTAKTKLSFYDVKSTLNDSEITFEVKNDLYASKSGNIAIETYNPVSKKKSGISITKSDFWVHVVEDKVWIVKTDNLKLFIETHKPLRKIAKAVDGNATIILYKIYDILPKVFKRIDHLSGEEIKETIQRLILQG